MCPNVKTYADSTRASSGGLLVVSFGTTHRETCRETIGAIEDDLAKAMPFRRLYRGWTSRMIIRRIEGRDGIHIDTVEEALERMAAEGITDVLTVPTHLIAGAEYDKVIAALREKAGCFDRLAVGRPLLDSPDDLDRLAEVLAGEWLGDPDRATEASAGEWPDPGAALVLMGHGSAEREDANEVYVRQEEAFRRQGRNNVWVGTVEGRPSLDDVLEKMALAGEDAPDQEPEETADARMPGQARGIQRVLLAPLMIVAGDHAVNDMAGDGPESWAGRLAAAGYDPQPVLRGLGSSAGVRVMFACHARDAGPVDG